MKLQPCRNLTTVILNKASNQHKEPDSSCLPPVWVWLQWSCHIFPGGSPCWLSNGLTSHLHLLPLLIRAVHTSIVLGLQGSSRIFGFAYGSQKLSETPLSSPLWHFDSFPVHFIPQRYLVWFLFNHWNHHQAVFLQDSICFCFQIPHALGQSTPENSIHFATLETWVRLLLALNSEGSPSWLAWKRETAPTQFHL